MHAEEVYADEVAGHYELYARLRADRNTIAYVSIYKPDFFDYATCVDACDSALEFINQTFDGRLAPIAFYLKAYTSTWNKWTDDIKGVRKP